MSRRSMFRSSDGFSVYYGSGELKQLVRYDVVVVEPGHRTRAEVDALKVGGTLVIAYVSVMEVHSGHPLTRYVCESDFLREDHAPYDYVMQTQYQNHVVDIRSTEWRGHLLRHIGELLTRGGYDGVFLDTIGDVEMPNIPSGLQQIEAAANFVEQIRRWFPEAILIQNNGLESLCQHTARYLDAIVWENPPLDVSSSKRWVQLIAERLVYLRTVHTLRVFILFEGARQENRPDFLRGRAFAQEYGFTPYFSPVNYQSFHS